MFPRVPTASDPQGPVICWLNGALTYFKKLPRVAFLSLLWVAKESK